MVKINISLQDTISNIKKITDLTLLNPKNFDKMRMSLILSKPHEHITIAIPFEGDYYRLKILQYVRKKSIEWKINLSDEFISNEITEFILLLKTDRKKYLVIGKTVKNWLKKLKNISLINFRFILPVNNVDYRKDIDLGKIKLKKLTLKNLKSFVPFKNGTIKYFTPSQLFKELNQFNKTDIYSIIEIQARDKEQAYHLANSRLKRLIHAMKLFNPNSGITERENYFPQTKYHYVEVNLDSGSYVAPFSNLHLNAHIWPSKNYWKRVNPHWKKLCLFLFSDNPTEIQSIIQSVLYWYGEGNKETEDELSKFLKFMHGLEMLLIFDNKWDKGKRIADRIAKIFGKNSIKNFEHYKNLMIQYYDARSGLIHSGKILVNTEDVGTTHNWLRNLLFEYIKFSKKYSSVKTMFKKEYSITL